MSNKQAWIGFFLLGLIWGSSFLFIRIGVEQLGPFEVVFIRTGIAAIGLTLVAYVRGKRLPIHWVGIRDLLILGVVNTVIPFALITWGEQSIDSGLAAVLQATAALFTLVVAHFAFADERITVKKVGGLIVGFIGVIILVSQSWQDGQVVTSSLAGQLAIVVASFFYAIGGTYSRKVLKKGIEPIIAAAGAMITTAIISGVLMVIAPSLGGAPVVKPTDMQNNVLFAVVTLGLLNTFIAYIIFYSIIPVLGAARTSMVTYIVPAVGSALGAIFLDEVVDVRLLLGAALIMTGIGIVNLRLVDIARWLFKKMIRLYLSQWISNIGKQDCMDIHSVKPQLRQMTPEDGARGAVLVKKIGWSQTAGIWEQTIHWSGDGSFCLATDDELLATVIVICYGTDLAWIGMVVTHPDYQRQGLARQMMEIGLEYAHKRGVQTIMLDASQMGYPLYVKLGFQLLYKIEVFEGIATSNNSVRDAHAPRELTEADIPSIVEMDTQLMGVARPNIIRDLAEKSGQGWVMGESGHIEGYLIAKPGNQSISIGPWYHQDTKGAEALLECAIAATQGTGLKFHIPESNSAAKAIVRRHGLEFNRFVTRMVLGGEVPGEMDQQYSVAALATG